MFSFLWADTLFLEKLPFFEIFFKFNYMERLTYKQAYDLIIEAYFKDEIEPFKPQFCFCGTLCDNTNMWTATVNPQPMNYLLKEYGKMEFALLKHLGVHYMIANGSAGDSDYDCKDEIPDYENRLFDGMCAALDVLKEIHRSRGEDVDEELKLTKRVLQTA